MLWKSGYLGFLFHHYSLHLLNSFTVFVQVHSYFFVQGLLFLLQFFWFLLNAGNLLLNFPPFQQTIWLHLLVFLSQFVDGFLEQKRIPFGVFFLLLFLVFEFLLVGKGVIFGLQEFVFHGLEFLVFGEELFLHFFVLVEVILTECEELSIFFLQNSMRLLLCFVWILHQVRRYRLQKLLIFKS